MLHRLGVALTAAIMTVAGWAGPAQADPPPVTAATQPPPPACPPVLPLTASVAGTTETSVTISYSMFVVGPPCGFTLPLTMTLYTSQADAQQQRDPVATATSGLEQHGSISVDGLTPDTAYWFRFAGADAQQDMFHIGGPARTVAVTGCVASAAVDASWPGGYLSTVTVRNIGSRPLHGWAVSWQWPGDERIQAAWGGQVNVDGQSVVVRDVAYNGTVAPGATITFGLVVASGGAPAAIDPTCVG